MNVETLTPRVVHNGYAWTVAGQAPPTIGRLFEAFPEIEDLAGARTIKSNHFRTVVHVPSGSETAPGRGLLVKVYRYTGRWDRLRYRWIPHRALKEWTALKRFAELGLPTARAWAVAEERKGGTIVGGGLLVEFLEGTKPLSECVHELFGDPAGHPCGLRVLTAAAQLVRRMHDHGVWHRDLHSGNLLRDSADTIFLIDLHTCVFQRRLWRWQRLSGLAKLLHSLRNSIPTEGLHRIVDAYGSDVLGGSTDEALRKLLVRVNSIHKVRVKSRSKRCFLPSTQFQVTREPGRITYHLRKIPAAHLEPLLCSEAPGSVIKTSPRGWVARSAAGGVEVCVKFRRLPPLESLQALFESHRLRRAYKGGHALSIRGIATAQVVALSERRVFGLVREAHLITEWLGDAVPLDQYLLNEYWGTAPEPAACRRKHRLAEAVGGFVRKVHDCALYPHDLSPQNLLVRPGRLDSIDTLESQALYLTDLDHLYLWKPLRKEARLKNLTDIANLPEGHISTADRLRGLKFYARGDQRFWGHRFIAELRERILREHLKVLSGYSRRERLRGETRPS